MPAFLVTSSSYRQAGNLILKRLGVQVLVFKVPVKPAPIHAFHWLAVVRENRGHPDDYRLEVTPQGGCGSVLLMRGHVILDRLALALNPLDCGFKIILAGSASLSHTRFRPHKPDLSAC